MERYDPNLMEDKSKSGRFSCNFHGFISRRGLEELTLFDRHLNSEKYCEILENTVFPAMDHFQANFIPYFMHDRYKYSENMIRHRFFEISLYFQIMFKFIQKSNPYFKLY